MSVNTVKEVRIKNTGGTYDIQPIGAEGQYIDISRDANGNIIEDITASGVVVDSTEGLAETLKNIEESIADSNEFSEMTDVDFTSLADKNLVQYDSTAAKWKNITMDSTPTANSNKPVTSGGIKTELNKKLNDYANGASAWDTTPTASSNKPVTSGGIKTALDLKTNDADLKAVAKSGDASDVDYTNTTSGLAATKVQAAIDEVAAGNQTLTNNVDVLIENGAINNLPSEAVSTTVTTDGANLTFTVNEDKSVTVNGTNGSSIVRYPIFASADASQIYKAIGGKGPYKISGVNNGSANTYGLVFQGSNTTSGAHAEAHDLYNGDEVIGDYSYYRCYIIIKAGVTVNNVKFEPMMTSPSYSGDYVPYAMTNKELTENCNIKTALVSVPASYHGGAAANVNFEKRNGVVHAWWAGGTPTFPAQGTEYEIGDIPEGFIPSQVQTGYGVDMNSFTRGMYLQLRTNGKIYIFGYNTGTGGTVNALVSLVYFA